MQGTADSLMSEVIKGGEELSFIYTVLFGLFALFACVSISIVFARNLLSQLGADPNELSEVAERISDGDIDIDFKSENRTGVYKVMKEMVDALKRQERLMRLADGTGRGGLSVWMIPYVGGKTMLKIWQTL